MKVVFDEKKKRPAYRKSLFHAYSVNTTKDDLPQLVAHGTKPKSQIATPIIKDYNTFVSPPRQYAPPPSSCDDEIGRLLYIEQHRNQSRPPSPESPVEKDECIPFRLPVLNRSPQLRHASTNSPTKGIRSTLSNYLQKFY